MIDTVIVTDFATMRASEKTLARLSNITTRWQAILHGPAPRKGRDAYLRRKLRAENKRIVAEASEAARSAFIAGESIEVF